MLRSTLVEKTQKRIKQMILNKEYDGRNYLPSEGRLCERFGVSRATVREAVRSMEVRGFLRREHGKGVRVIDNRVQVMTQFISDMVSMNTSDLLEIIEVRRIIEVEATRLAALHADAADLDCLHRFLDGMESANAMDDAYYECDLRFHIHLVKASKNNLLFTLTNAYTPLMKDLVLASSHSDFIIEKKFHFHRGIFDSVCARDPDAAAENMRKHMKTNYENFMEHMCKTGT